MTKILTSMLLAPAAIGLAVFLAGSGQALACGSSTETDLAGSNLDASVWAEGDCHDTSIFMRGQAGSVGVHADGYNADTRVYAAGTNKGSLDVVTGGGKAMVFAGICRNRDQRVIPVGASDGTDVVVVGCR